MTCRKGHFLSQIIFPDLPESLHLCPPLKGIFMENMITDLLESIPADVDWAGLASQYVPAEIDWAGLVSQYIPTEIDWAGLASQYIPAEINRGGITRFGILFVIASLILGFLGRAVMGKRSGLNHALSSAMGIACIYAVTIIIYSCSFTQLSQFLVPLPFVAFSGETMVLLPFQNAQLTDICYHILSMLILAFLVNLLDTLIPEGKRIIGWYLLRFLTVILAMAAHYVVTGLLASLLPDVLVTYAPVILLAVLAAMLLLGIVNVFLGLVLTVTNPILGAIYTFFFSNKIGKQLGKAVLTTLVLTAVFFTLEKLGFTVILISEAALAACIPFIIILLVLWYLIGHLL